MDAARAAVTAEESVVAAKAAAAVSAKATEKSTEKGIHAVWSDHIAEKQTIEKQAATTEEAAGDPAIAGKQQWTQWRQQGWKRQCNTGRLAAW